jgi:hypothetical protein
MNKLVPRAVSLLLLLSLCAARGAAAEGCHHAQPLAETQLVAGDAWFVHAGADRVLLSCGGGDVSLWLHDGCDDEGRPKGIVPCDDQLLWVLPAPVGGRLYVRVWGEGVLHTPLQHEWAARRKERLPTVGDGEALSRHSSERRRLLQPALPPPRSTDGMVLSAAEAAADGEALSRHSLERHMLLQPALPPPRLTGGRALSDVESLPPPPEPSAADPTVSTLDALQARFSHSRSVSLHVVGRIELGGMPLLINGGQRVTLWSDEGANIDAVSRSRVLEVRVPPLPCARRCLRVLVLGS